MFSLANHRWKHNFCVKHFVDGSGQSPDSPWDAALKSPVGRFTPVSRSPSLADVVVVVRPTKDLAQANETREDRNTGSGELPHLPTRLD